MNFTGKRVAIVGGGGYLGSKLGLQLSRKHFVINIDPLALDTADNMNFLAWKAEDIVEILDYVQPDQVVNVAALAHDPEQRLHAEAVRYCNVDVALAIQKWCNLVGVPDVHISSMSTFDDSCGAYIRSKQELETRLISETTYRQTTILRLGTLYGPSPIRSFRPHLLLNSMVCGAVLDGQIVVNGKGLLKRPVTNISRVVDEIEFLLEHDRPRGTLYNMIDYSANLRTYAELVKNSVTCLTNVEIIYKDLPDKRDYGWTGYVPAYQGLPHYILEMGQWVSDNATEIQARRAVWFENLQKLNDEIVQCLNLQNQTLRPPTSIR